MKREAIKAPKHPDRITWTTAAGGGRLVNEGIIICQIPADTTPKDALEQSAVKLGDDQQAAFMKDHGTAWSSRADRVLVLVERTKPFGDRGWSKVKGFVFKTPLVGHLKGGKKLKPAAAA